MVIGVMETVIDQGDGQAVRIYNAHLSAKYVMGRKYQHLIRNDENQSDLIDCWMLGGQKLNESVIFTAGTKANTAIGQQLDFAFVEAAAGRYDHQQYWVEFDNVTSD